MRNDEPISKALPEHSANVDGYLRVVAHQLSLSRTIDGTHLLPLMALRVATESVTPHTPQAPAPRPRGARPPGRKTLSLICLII